MRAKKSEGDHKAASHRQDNMTRSQTQNKKRSRKEVRGSFSMFVESGCISTNIEFTVP